MDSWWKTFGLLLVGLALLLNPVVPGIHFGAETVYRYEAASVNYTAGEGLELRYVETGQRLEPVPVDDEIACEDQPDRWFCRVIVFVQQNGTVPGYASAGASLPEEFEFVYLDNRFYRPTTVERSGETHLALDPVNESDPLQEVAATDLTSLERRTVESGSVVTYRDLQRKDQLLRADGGYFVVRQTARKRYTRGRDNCHGSAEGFCNDADWKRRIDTSLTIGSWLVGFGLVLHSWVRIRT
jgi:hypothetical protein